MNTDNGRFNVALDSCVIADMFNCYMGIELDHNNPNDRILLKNVYDLFAEDLELGRYKRMNLYVSKTVRKEIYNGIKCGNIDGRMHNFFNQFEIMDFTTEENTYKLSKIRNQIINKQIDNNTRIKFFETDQKNAINDPNILAECIMSGIPFFLTLNKRHMIGENNVIKNHIEQVARENGRDFNVMSLLEFVKTFFPERYEEVKKNLSTEYTYTTKHLEIKRYNKPNEEYFFGESSGTPSACTEYGERGKIITFQKGKKPEIHNLGREKT